MNFLEQCCVSVVRLCLVLDLNEYVYVVCSVAIPRVLFAPGSVLHISSIHHSSHHLHFCTA